MDLRAHAPVSAAETEDLVALKGAAGALAPHQQRGVVPVAQLVLGDRRVGAAGRASHIVCNTESRRSGWKWRKRPEPLCEPVFMRAESPTPSREVREPPLLAQARVQRFHLAMWVAISNHLKIFLSGWFEHKFLSVVG